MCCTHRARGTLAQAVGLQLLLTTAHTWRTSGIWGLYHKGSEEDCVDWRRTDTAR